MACAGRASRVHGYAEILDRNGRCTPRAHGTRDLHQASHAGDGARLREHHRVRRNVRLRTAERRGRSAARARRRHGVARAARQRVRRGGRSRSSDGRTAPRVGRVPRRRGVHGAQRGRRASLDPGRTLELRRVARHVRALRRALHDAGGRARRRRADLRGALGFPCVPAPADRGRVGPRGRRRLVRDPEQGSTKQARAMANACRPWVVRRTISSCCPMRTSSRRSTR